MRPVHPLPVPGLLSVCVCVQTSPSFKNTSHTGLELALLTSFELNYLFKDTISKYSHILSTGG